MFVGESQDHNDDRAISVDDEWNERILNIMTRHDERA
jgi:hypothetical protein